MAESVAIVTADFEAVAEVEDLRTLRTQVAVYVRVYCNGKVVSETLCLLDVD